MRIFFLDDNHDRQLAFRQRSKKHDVDFASNYDRALELLGSKPYDLIYLDHDLSLMDENYNFDSNEKTGYDVAKFLSRAEHNFGKIVFVHSLNPSGRANIKTVLAASFRVYLPEDLRAAMLWTIEVDELVGRIELR